MKTRFYLFILITYLFISCNNHSTEKKNSITNDSLSLCYANGFSVKYFTNYKKVTVKNPWQKNKILATYYLTFNDTTGTPKDGEKIVVPITKLASSSVTHLEFLQLLNKIEVIKGFCNPKLVFNKKIREKRELNQLIDLGDSFAINIEKAMALHPQAIMMTAYNQTNPNLERLKNTKIPIIYNNEWMEEHILGRAEWIKFVALFFNEEKKADSIFRQTVKNYNHLKKIAQKTKYSPSIISGTNFKGTWYMPSGKSYMSQLFRDANGSYFYSNNTSKGSLPLSIEVVLKHFVDADIWLNANFNSYDELISADEKYQLFKAVKTKQVYNFKNRFLPTGANDYWEGAIAHPDKLLGDLIKILHPNSLPNWKLYYAKKITQHYDK